MNLYKSCFSGRYAFKQVTRNENLSFTGVSIFEPLSNEKIRHTKNGSYILNGQEQEFFQVRYYIFQKDSIIMQKHDGCQLHEFPFPQNPRFPLTLNHTHYCSDDIYDITIKILSVDEYQTEYIIKGPKKDEIIQSFYNRIN